MLAVMLAAAAATLPLGVWPAATGAAATTVEDIDFYLVEPKDDYTILAVQALASPLPRFDAGEAARLAALAIRLGADAVLLLGEMAEPTTPRDAEDPLPTTGRYVTAVFIVFEDSGAGEGGKNIVAARYLRARPRTLAPQHGRGRTPEDSATGVRIGALVLTHRLVGDILALQILGGW
jgi:hypothetical protein